MVQMVFVFPSHQNTRWSFKKSIVSPEIIQIGINTTTYWSLCLYVGGNVRSYEVKTVGHYQDKWHSKAPYTVFELLQSPVKYMHQSAKNLSPWSHLLSTPYVMMNCSYYLLFSFVKNENHTSIILISHSGEILGKIVVNPQIHILQSVLG